MDFKRLIQYFLVIFLSVALTVDTDNQIIQIFGALGALAYAVAFFKETFGELFNK